MEGRLGEDPVWWQGERALTFAGGVAILLALRSGRRLALLRAFLMFVVGGPPARGLPLGGTRLLLGRLVALQCVLACRAGGLPRGANLALVHENASWASVAALRWSSLPRAGFLAGDVVRGFSTPSIRPTLLPFGSRGPGSFRAAEADRAVRVYSLRPRGLGASTIAAIHKDRWQIARDCASGQPPLLASRLSEDAARSPWRVEGSYLSGNRPGFHADRSARFKPPAR